MVAPKNMPACCGDNSSHCAIMGYTIMAMVESADTPMTVNKVAFSFCGWLGSAAESANAAEAPQIAVAPPVSMPNKRWKPISLATTTDTEMVTIIKVSTSTIGCQPNAVICS